MNAGDTGMAEHGDMFSNRGKANPVLKTVSPLLFHFGAADRFAPDVLLGDGDSLSDYGCPATVLHIPGHSSGSIGVLTAAGDFFCGDLLGNTKTPEFGMIMPDPASGRASVQRLQGMGVTTIYPGHGRPFTPAELAVAGV